MIRCPFCKKLPEPVNPEAFKAAIATPGGNPEVFCATEGCPAFANEVSLEVWERRAPHETLVKHIPSDEPIFVIRAKDSIGLVIVYQWIALAEKHNVNEAKLDSAVETVGLMQLYQDTLGNKLPD